MKKIVLCSLFVTAAVLPLAASAHLPRYVMGEEISLHSPKEIDSPTVSQVFYGQMKGTPDYYHFKLDQEQEILIGLLTPLNETEFPKAELIAQKGKVRDLVGPFDEAYFEEFGGDYYLRGPEKTFTLPADNYLIKIYNGSSTGRYALVVGNEEKFTISETIATLTLLPIIKQKFFDRPILEMFLAILSFIFVALGLAYSFNKRWKISWRFFIAGVLTFVFSAILLLIENPFNILGFLKLALFITAVIITGIYLRKKGEVGKVLTIVQPIIWLLVVLFTVASF